MVIYHDFVTFVSSVDSNCKLIWVILRRVNASDSVLRGATRYILLRSCPQQLHEHWGIACLRRRINSRLNGQLSTSHLAKQSPTLVLRPLHSMPFRNSAPGDRTFSDRVGCRRKW